MAFYIKDKEGKKIATFEYNEGTDECSDCNEIIIKAGSLMSKHILCSDKWYDCKWVEDARQDAIKNNIVEEYNEDYFILLKDMNCESPRKAVSVLLGHIQNNSWDIIEDDEGHSLREVYRN